MASLDRPRARLEPPLFHSGGIRLKFIEPGTSFHLNTVAAGAMDYSGTALALLERAVQDLVRDYNSGKIPGLEPIDERALRDACCSTTSNRNAARSTVDGPL